MPTGYTADISKGITFEQFAMNCARAFGACVTMRDDPSDAPIPEQFAPSSYHLTAQQEARDRLALLDAMTPKQAERAAASAWDKAETDRLARLDELRALRVKYEAMLLRAEAWVPPTPDHAELRAFMCQQISESIKFDCNEKYAAEPTPRLSGLAWRANEQRVAAASLVHHEQEHANEVRRAEERTAWVKALRGSLARQLPEQK